MFIFSIVNIIFNILVISALIYMYSKSVKLKNVYKDLDTIFNQISEIILHLNKSDKALSGLAASLDKIIGVFTDSVLPALPKTGKEPEAKEPGVKAPAKRSRKKVTE